MSPVTLVTKDNPQSTRGYDIVTVMETFGEWLEKEMRDRDWSMSKLAQLSGVTHVTISRIISGERNPSGRLCRNIAGAFDLPPERVFRKVGLLPPRIAGVEDSESKEKLLDYFEALEEIGQQTMLAVASTLYEQRAKYKTGGSDDRE